MFKEIKRRIQYKKFKTAYLQAYTIEMAMWQLYPEDRKMPKMNLPSYKEIKSLLGENNMIKFNF